MKFTYKYVLVLLIMLPVVLPGQDSLKILTYNIEGKKPGTMSGLRLTLIIGELKLLDPDIIALQEINEDINGNGEDNQGLLIKEALSDHFGMEYSYYQQFTHLSWDNQFRESIGIITKFPVEDSGFFQLVTGVFPRKIVWNRIITPIGEINFFNTHLSFNSQAVRLQQVEQVDDYIKSTSTANGIATNIVCGDFNDPPTSPVIEHLTEQEGDNFYFDSFRETNPGIPGHTVPSSSPTSRIDYVFYANKSALSADTSYVVMTEPFTTNIYYSDHLGVMSIFQESNNAGTGAIPQWNKKPFILHQNYPNPFAHSTSIEYEIFEKNHVTVSLYDKRGKELAILVNEKKESGKYIIKMNGKRFGNNLCFVRIIAGGISESKKLILIN